MDLIFAVQVTTEKFMLKVSQRNVGVKSEGSDDAHSGRPVHSWVLDQRVKTRRIFWHPLKKCGPHISCSQHLNLFYSGHTGVVQHIDQGLSKDPYKVLTFG